MIFWKIDDETIRCLINKDEITNMGYDVKTISQDARQMEAFLETIVQNSREYVEWNPENGIQNYMARALPADQFLITISCTFQDELIDRNLEQIRRMTEALQSKVSEERLGEIASLSGDEKEQAFAALSQDLYDVCNGNLPDPSDGQEEEDRETALPGTDRQTELPDRKLVFESLDHIIRFAGLLQKNTLYTSTLFKSDRQYVLLVRFDRRESNKDALAFILTAEEYGGVCSPVHYDEAYMMEHGRELIRDNALEVLAGM